MGSYSSGIADAIRQMGNAGARNEMNKGQIYGNLAQQIGNAPQQYLGIQQGLQDNKHRKLLQDTQAKKIKQDQELEALLGTLKTPEERWTATRNYLGVHDPEKAFEMDQLAFRAVKAAFDAKSGQPGQNPIQAGVEAQLPANAMSQVTPLEQQQVPNQPMHFPSIGGQPGFDATPPTQEQMGMADYIQKLRTAEAANKFKPVIAGPDSTVMLPGQAPIQMPGRQVNPKAGQSLEDYAAREEIKQSTAEKHRRPLADKSGSTASTASTDLREKQTRLAIKVRKERKLSELNKEHAKAAESGSFMSQETYDAKREQIQQEFLDDLNIAGFGGEPGPATSKAAPPDRDAAIQELRRRKVAGY